jgi:hypothetical protein
MEAKQAERWRGQTVLLSFILSQVAGYAKSGSEETQRHLLTQNVRPHAVSVAEKQL